MRFRKSDAALMALAAVSMLLALAFVHAGLAGNMTAGLETSSHLVRQLGLSDLALFTEARYTRHPSQADLHSAFQDHPVSLDHFPTGSLISPPENFGPTGGFAAREAK